MFCTLGDYFGMKVRVDSKERGFPVRNLDDLRLIGQASTFSFKVGFPD
jgi:hypothetical protein